MPRRYVKAFTLLELLVVVGVLGTLFTLAVPALWSARQQGKRVACQSNQRQIALAMQSYAMDFEDRFPIAQYFDQRERAFVAWDTITRVQRPHASEPGLIWHYVEGAGIQQCPSFDGAGNTSGDEYSGYNYNTTYIGRGENEGTHLRLGTAPACVSEVRFAATAALVGDGGWSSGANKFMRAPWDSGTAESTVHAGAQAFRHADSTNVTFVDGHGSPTKKRSKKLQAQPINERLLGWPRNGFLSLDDRAYAHR